VLFGDALGGQCALCGLLLGTCRLERPTCFGERVFGVSVIAEDGAASGGCCGRGGRCAPCLAGARAQLHSATRLPWAFWVLCSLGALGYADVVSFNNVAEAFLQARYDAAGEAVSLEAANVAMSVLFFSAAVAASFAGGVVDRAGCRGGFMAAASAVVAACHLALGLTRAGSPLPEVLFAGLGVSFAVFAAALWPSVSVAVPRSQLGLAYGLIGCVQNTAYVALPVLVALVQPPANAAIAPCAGRGYLCVSLLFAVLGAGAFAASMLIVLFEWRQAQQHERKARWKELG
jgi:hypothetical protein